MRPSRRLEQIPPYLFAELERKIAAKRAAGVDVISLGIGDPDTPTYPPIVAAAQRAVADPSTHTYPSNRGRPEFREAVAGFYAAPLRRHARPRDRGDAGDRRQGVHLQPQPRVPGPGRRRAGLRPRLSGLHRRPAAGRRRAGPDAARARARLRPRPRRDPRRDARARAADVHQLPQQPDRARSCPTGCSSARSSWPASTTSSSCTTTPTARRPSTATSRRRSWPRPGAKEVGVEVFSLSKGYNMTGWRCAAIVGNAEAIAQYWRLKSNIDSGLFEAIQLAGAAALAPEVDAEVRAMNAVYAAPARPGLRRAGPGRGRRDPAQGHDLRLGADPDGLRHRRRLLRARARAGRGGDLARAAPTAPTARASSGSR